MRAEDQCCPDCGSLPGEHTWTSHPEAPPGSMATMVPKCSKCSAVWYQTTRILVRSGQDCDGHRMVRWAGDEEYPEANCKLTLTPQLKHEIRAWLTELIAEATKAIEPIGEKIVPDGCLGYPPKY